MGESTESGVDSDRKLGSLRTFMMCSPRPNGGRRGWGWACVGMDGSTLSGSSSKVQLA